MPINEAQAQTTATTYRGDGRYPPGLRDGAETGTAASGQTKAEVPLTMETEITREKQARFPWVKTLELQPGIDRKVVRELTGLAFVERSEDVILLGPPGVGKTHRVVALGVKAADACSCHWIS